MQKKTAELETTIRTMQEQNKLKENNLSAVETLEQEIDLIKEQFENAKLKNEALNDTMTNSKRFYDQYKQNSKNI